MTLPARGLTADASASASGCLAGPRAGLQGARLSFLGARSNTELTIVQDLTQEGEEGGDDTGQQEGLGSHTAAQPLPTSGSGNKTPTRASTTRMGRCLNPETACSVLEDHFQGCIQVF